MANEIASELILFEVNSGTPQSPTWEKLVCLTEKSFNGTTANNEIVTDCDNDFVRNLAGKRNYTMDGSGYANANPEANEGSYEATIALWKSGETKQYRMRNADNSYYRQGEGYISSVSESSSAGEYLQFSFSVQGSGDLLFVPAT